MRGTQFAQLSSFVAVAEHRSFTKAATQLGISTPSLSQAVRRLEEQFGVRLLNRTTRSVSLTEAGEQLFEQLGPVLAGVETAIDTVNSFRDKPTGTLRLAVHPLAAATILAPLMASFSSEYPDITLDISVDVEQRDIVGERFDAGIQSCDEIAQDMIALPIGGNLPFSLVASPDYLARAGRPDAPEDISRHNCVGYRWSAGAGTSWTFENRDERRDVAIQGNLSVNDPHFALRAALDGIGIALLPTAWIESSLADGKLVQVLPDWSTRLADFFIYYSSRRHMPVKLRAFTDFLRSKTKKTERIAVIRGDAGTSFHVPSGRMRAAAEAQI